MVLDNRARLIVRYCSKLKDLLKNLTPDIIVAVMQGKTPPQMTLAKAVNNLPEDWQEQRELFGFVSK